MISIHLYIGKTTVMISFGSTFMSHFFVLHALWEKKSCERTQTNVMLCKRCILVFFFQASVLLHYCIIFVQVLLLSLSVTKVYNFKNNFPKWVQTLMSTWFVFFRWCWNNLKYKISKKEQKKNENENEKKVLMLLSFVVVVSVLVAFIDTWKI